MILQHDEVFPISIGKTSEAEKQWKKMKCT